MKWIEGGIPFGMQCFKLAKLVMMPFGAASAICTRIVQPFLDAARCAGGLFEQF